MKIVGPINSGVASGGAGVATANSTTSVVVCGLVQALYVKYLDAPPAGTTDVTVETAGQSHPAMTILSLANAATDGWFFPRAATVSPTGAALLYAPGGTAVSSPVPIADRVKVTIAQANNGDGVDIWILLNE